MLEVIVSVAIAGVTGLGVMSSRFHTRCTELERRSDQIELKLAERYMPRAEVTAQLEKFEEHFLRIETKLDNLIHNTYK